MDKGAVKVPKNGGKYAAIGNTHTSKFEGNCTQRRPFNLMVGLVILINAIVIGFEADLGLLGTGGRDWGSVKEDLTLLGYRHAALAQAQSVVHQALSMDEKYKNKASDYATKSLTKQDVSMSDLGMSSQGSDLRKGAHISDGAYTLIEYMFVMFYTLEIFIRTCNMGCRKSLVDPWWCFDLVTWLLGVADLALPIALKFQSAVPVVNSIQPKELYQILSVLRIARVLRVIRMFRVFPELRALLQPFFDALWVVFRISLLVLLIDFILAVVLTTLVGQRASASPHSTEITLKFGSIGRSMQTLGAVMTLNGWQRCAVLLSDYVPGWFVIPMLVLYIMLCTLAVYGIVTGAICDSLDYVRRQDEKVRDRALLAHRFQLEQALRDKLESAGKIKEEYLTRSEFERVLNNEWYIASDIQVLDPEMTTKRMMEIFDQIVRDNPDARDFVRGDCLAEAIASQSSLAQAFPLIDFKYQCRTARKDMQEHQKALQKDMTERHKEGMAMKEHVRKDQIALKSGVGKVQDASSKLRELFKKLGDKMALVDKESDKVRHERKAVFEQIRMNVKGLTKDVNQALNDQQSRTTKQVKMVQTNAQEATASIHTMKQTVDDLPKTIKKATRKLEEETKNIAATVQGLLEHADVRLDSATAATLAAAATAELEPDPDEAEEAPEEDFAPYKSEDPQGEKVFGACQSEAKGGIPAEEGEEQPQQAEA